MKLAIFVALLVAGTQCIAADYQPLHGTYKIGGATLLDPPANEPQTTHFYVDLHGRTARDLYEALKAKAIDGVCGEPGDLTKRSGSVQCTKVKGGKEYYCAFGIELRSNRVVSGVVC